MARPLRIEYPGATHHLMSRGNQRRSVFEDERDYRRLLQGPELSGDTKTDPPGDTKTDPLLDTC